MDPQTGRDSFVSSNYKVPRWATGCISSEDAAFLFDLISVERPKRVVEIGVASGVSTAFLSRILANQNPSSKLFSFDAIDYFYANKEYKCGAFLEESFGACPSNVILATGVSSSQIAERAKNDDPFDLGFIDGNHHQPWPCLDMFSVIQTTTPGSWIALHDVNLPFIHAAFPHFGPFNLIATWPGEKVVSYVRSGAKSNIGAIRLLARKEDSIKAVLDCLAMRWTTRVPEASLKMAEDTIAMTSPALSREFRELALTMNERQSKPQTLSGDFVLVNFNPWTQMNSAPWQSTFTLHANPPGWRPLELRLENLLANGARRLVFPQIRHAKTGAPVRLSLSVLSDDGKLLSEHGFSVEGEMPKALVIPLPNSGGADTLTVKLGVSTPEKKTEGAWAQFDPIYTV